VTRSLLVGLLLLGCTREDVPPLPKVVLPVASATSGLEVDDSPTGPAAFLAWASEARTRPSAYGTTEECYGQDSSRSGICARTHFPDRFTSWDIDYVKRDPKGFKLHARFTSTLTCSSIGGDLAREWRYASLEKSLCKFTRGPLVDLYMLIQNAGPKSALSAGSDAFLFSTEYLNASASWREVVMSQGR
jgi:hypothetical protein